MFKKQMSVMEGSVMKSTAAAWATKKDFISKNRRRNN